MREHNHKINANKPRQVRTHEFNPSDETIPEDIAPPDEVEEADTTQLLDVATGKDDLDQTDIRKVLATTAKKSRFPTSRRPEKATNLDTKIHEVQIDGRTFRAVNHTKVHYQFSQLERAKVGGLLDRGANGGLAGSDVRVLYKTSHKVDVSGFDKHTLPDIALGTTAAVVASTTGPVIIICHHMAILGRGSSIFCCGQIEHAGHEVNDRSRKLPNGKQCITLDDGSIIPLAIRNGLPYMDI